MMIMIMIRTMTTTTLTIMIIRNNNNNYYYYYYYYYITLACLAPTITRVRLAHCRTRKMFTSHHNRGSSSMAFISSPVLPL